MKYEVGDMVSVLSEPLDTMDGCYDRVAGVVEAVAEADDLQAVLVQTQPT